MSGAALRSYQFRAILAALETVFPRPWWQVWYPMARIRLFCMLEEAYTREGFFLPCLSAGVDPAGRIVRDLRRVCP